MAAAHGYIEIHFYGIASLGSEVGDASARQRCSVLRNVTTAATPSPFGTNRRWVGAHAAAQSKVAKTKKCLPRFAGVVHVFVVDRDAGTRLETLSSQLSGC